MVIWSSGRSHEGAILADLQDHFRVLRVHEVRWSPDLVPQNYSRFYRGRLVPPYRNVEIKKGRGPLLAVTVLDRAPVYARRDTLHGPAVVDANLFDAKTRYREWTGPDHLVHASDTAAEARRDLMLLLGVDAETYLGAHPGWWDGTIRPLRRDLSGARGWSSPAQLFDALNCSIDYVALGGLDPLQLLDEGSAEVVELLTANYTEMIAVTNARPLLGQIPRWGGRFLIRLGERSAPFAFRFVGDRYFDPDWQRAVLERRTWCARGYFRPAPQDDLETLAYHALVHQPSLTVEHRTRLATLARALGRTEWAESALDDVSGARATLDAMLRRRDHAFVRPRDPFTYYSFHAAGARWPWLRQRLADLRRTGARRYQRGSARARARYLEVRDLVARSAPGIRRVWRLLRGRRRRAGFQAPTRPRGDDGHSAGSTATMGELG